MGDNIWLHDRDAVRTPMQWTPDRNAGFSTADPGKLYLPVIQSLVYHYNHVNVEAQMATSSSLLHWVRGMLAGPRAGTRCSGSATSCVCPTENEACCPSCGATRVTGRSARTRPPRDGAVRQQPLLAARRPRRSAAQE